MSVFSFLGFETRQEGVGHHLEGSPDACSLAMQARGWAAAGLSAGCMPCCRRLLASPPTSPPALASLPVHPLPGESKAPASDKGKGKVGEEAASSGASAGAFPGDDGVALATMDIFAGCGGLSEGMHQAGKPSQKTRHVRTRDGRPLARGTRAFLGNARARGAAHPGRTCV